MIAILYKTALPNQTNFYSSYATNLMASRVLLSRK